jgi:hypothetical protein
MVLNKLFKKGQSEQYFLQIDTAETTTATEVKEEATVATEEPTSESTEAKAEASAPVAYTPSNVSYEEPAWVKAIKNYSQPESNGDSTTGNNFAGTYVSNNVTFSRRRPGGSLSKFKQMASKMSR